MLTCAVGRPHPMAAHPTPPPCRGHVARPVTDDTMRRMTTPRPQCERERVPSGVLAAYGIRGAVRDLAGGQGTSGVAGGLVLKPGADIDVTTWLARLCAHVEQLGFQLPAPVSAGDGRLVVDGWSATTYVEGSPVDKSDRSAAAWLPVLEAGRAFHRAVRHEPRPAFLETRTHRWAEGDRAAWGNAPHRPQPRSARLIHRLARHVVDERLAGQLVHGDLSGNVLLCTGRAPAVIDVSPYWRPAAYADAVVVVDALLWWESDPQLLDLGWPGALDGRVWMSLLARAFTFRLLAFDASGPASAKVDEEFARFDRVAQLLEAR